MENKKNKKKFSKMLDFFLFVVYNGGTSLRKGEKMENIKRLRAKSGLTQQQVANHLGTTKQYISLVETDKVKDISLEHAEKLSELFGCNLIEFYGYNNLKAKPKNKEQVSFLIKEIMKVYLNPEERLEIIKELQEIFVWE